jgi:hypothetical protein
MSVNENIAKYTLFMYIYDEYKKFNNIFTSVNDFINKNNIDELVEYYNENIKNDSNFIKFINYEYYKYYKIDIIYILKDKTIDSFLPPFRLLTYNKIHETSFGIHRYGWKYVISNYIKQSYSETDEFYFENPDFEWTSYAIINGLNTYCSSRKHYNNNIEQKTEMRFQKMKYIIFDEWLEKKYIWNNEMDTPIYKDRFISFIHDPPLFNVPDEIYNKFEAHDTKSLIEKNPNFLKEQLNLQILITLTDSHKKYIERNINISKHTRIYQLYHPLELYNKKYMFNIEQFIENKTKSIYIIGWWLRKYDIFLKLTCNKSIILKRNESITVNNYCLTQIREIISPENINYDIIQQPYFSEEEMYILNTKYNIKLYYSLDNNEYDKIFYNNIIFLDIFASNANNLLLECIMNNTPVLVCYNTSIIEYLGIDYPFYFTNYQDAENKSNNIELIITTHLYLKHMDKTKFTYNYFNNSLNIIIAQNI